LTHFSEKGSLSEPLRNFEGAGDFLVLFGHKKNKELPGYGARPHSITTRYAPHKISMWLSNAFLTAI
jgi:hypothetical protein